MWFLTMLCTYRASVTLDREGKYFKAPDGAMFGIEQKGRLYYLNSVSSSKNNASSLMKWHKIMGHCNFQDLRKLQNIVDGMKIADEQQGLRYSHARQNVLNPKPETSRD